MAMAIRVLIVDDAAFMRMMIKDILSKNGYEVVGEAENGQKAVEKFQELKPDLTTMDIIEFLCNEFDISRKTLGFAGLKDKDAITRQWVSIYKSALKKL